MKKLYTLSIVLISTLSFAQTYIPFTETGALNANGWTTHSGTAGQLTILTTPSDNGSSLSYPGLLASTGNRTSMIAGNSEDVNFPLPTPLTGTVYYSSLVKVLDDTQLMANATTGDYGLAFTSVASTSTTNFQGRIYFKKGSVAGTFLVGILNNSGGTAAPTFISTVLSINTTYLFVVKYDLTTNTASLFLNPTPGVAEPVATATNATGTTAAPTSIAGFVIRQGGSATVGTGNMEIDEIRIGTTFASVTPQVVAGLKDNNISGFSMYPNPLKGNTLNFTSTANGSKSVQIFDVVGKEVVKTTTTNNVVNVANLNAGVYIVKVTEEGKTATRKLVVQ